MLIPDITLTICLFFTCNAVMEKCSEDDSRTHQHEDHSNTTRREIKYSN